MIMILTIIIVVIPTLIESTIITKMNCPFTVAVQSPVQSTYEEDFYYCTMIKHLVPC